MPALTCRVSRVSRVEELPAKLYELDGEAMVCTTGDDAVVTCGNVVCNRGILYKLMGATGDEDAYNKLVAALANPSDLEEDEFQSWFRESRLSRVKPVKFYPCDGGRYFTGSVVIACHGGVCNASIHRVMHVSGERFTVRIVERHLYRLLKSAGGKLPAAIVLGAHPLVELAAASSPDFGVFELSVARSLGWRGKVCQTPRYSIPVPCDAGVILEGVFTGEVDWEGPFTDILGLCDKRRLQPVFRVEAVYESRSDPWVWQILPAGTEHKLLMGFPREALIWSHVSRVANMRVKVRLTPGSGGWLHAVIALEKPDRSVAVNAGLAALAAHPSLKHVVVTTMDVDVERVESIEWAIATRVRLDRDLVLIPGARGSSLDPSSDNGRTTKAIIIALPDEKRLEDFTAVERPCTLDTCS